MFITLQSNLQAQDFECESFIEEYETWVSETTDAFAKGKSPSSKEIAEIKMDFEQWEVNVDTFKKNGCATDANNERIKKACAQARKVLNIKEPK